MAAKALAGKDLQSWDKYLLGASRSPQRAVGEPQMDETLPDEAVVPVDRLGSTSGIAHGLGGRGGQAARQQGGVLARSRVLSDLDRSQRLGASEAEVVLVPAVHAAPRTLLHLDEMRRCLVVLMLGRHLHLPRV